MKIRRAEKRDLLQLTILFNKYRMFYNKPSELEDCKLFIKRRLENNDSCIFVAVQKSQLIGFVQLYESFSSVELEKIYILNDLFVLESARRKGIADKLMQRAEEFANNNQACRLLLETGKRNKVAQMLYIQRNWQMDTSHYYYTFSC